MRRSRQNRAAIIARRRLALIYAAITATSPTVFLPFEYAVHPTTGEQILFQDAACTVPVTTIGQQIGGVKWNGEIVAVQTTDARRPQWLGVGVGAFYDGVDDALFYPNSKSLANFIHATATATVSVFCERAATGSFHMLAANAISGGDVGFFYRFTPDDEFAFALNIGSGFTTATTVSAYPTTDEELITSAISPSDVKFYTGDTLQETIGWTAPTIEADASRDLGFGSIGGTDGSSSTTQVFSGTVKAIMLWDRHVSTTELAAVKGDLS